MSRRIVRAAGIALGYGLDRIFADPQRAHPVAGFGQAAAALESVTYRDSREMGVVHTGLLVMSVGAAGWFLERAARRSAVAAVAVTAAATWAAVGGTSLTRVGDEMHRRLECEDLEGARALLPSLCGRDPDGLDADALVRATVESLAENTSDAHVAPVFWAAVGGVPGVLMYRAANTLDAMIGHRSERYLRFGWAAARFDDLLNLVPARIAGLGAAADAPLVGGSGSAAVRAWRRDARKHPSPNAGVVEAAFAGALGVSLGGPIRYSYGEQIRPTLGDGPQPALADLRAAVRLSRAVQVTTVVAACAALVQRLRP